MNWQMAKDSSSNMTPDGKKILRPPNAFMVFAKEYRKTVAKQNPMANNKEVSVLLGNIWRQTTQAIKDEYHKKARELLALHKAKYPDYVYCPRDARKRKEERIKQKAKKAKNLHSKDGSLECQKETAVQRSEHYEGRMPGLNATNKLSSPGYVPNNPEFFNEYSENSSSDDVPLEPLGVQPVESASPSSEKTNSAAESINYAPPSRGLGQQPHWWESKEALSQENARPGLASGPGYPYPYPPFRRDFSSLDPSSYVNPEFLPSRFPYLPYPSPPPFYSASRPFPVGPPYPTSLLQKYGHFPPPFWGLQPPSPQQQGLWGRSYPSQAFSPYGPPPDIFSQSLGMYHDQMLRRGFAFPTAAFGRADEQGDLGKSSSDGKADGEQDYPAATSSLENRTEERDKQGSSLEGLPGEQGNSGRSSEDTRAEERNCQSRCFLDNQTGDSINMGRACVENQDAELDHQEGISSEVRSGELGYAERSFQQNRATEQDYQRAFQGNIYAERCNAGLSSWDATGYPESFQEDRSTIQNYQERSWIEDRANEIDLAAGNSMKDGGGGYHGMVQGTASLSESKDTTCRTEASNLLGEAKADRAAQKVLERAPEQTQNVVLMPPPDGFPPADFSKPNKLKNLTPYGISTEGENETPRPGGLNLTRMKNLEEALKSRNLHLTVSRQSETPRKIKPLALGSGGNINLSGSGRKMTQRATLAAVSRILCDSTTLGENSSRMAPLERVGVEDKLVLPAHREALVMVKGSRSDQGRSSSMSAESRGFTRPEASWLEASSSVFGDVSSYARPVHGSSGIELPPPSKKMCTGEGMVQAGPSGAMSDRPPPPAKGAFHTTGPISTAAIYGSKMEYNRNSPIIRKSPVPPVTFNGSQEPKT